MWRNNRICELLDIEHPIILAPMAGATTAELAAAVSNAGGLGSFGGASATPDRLRQVIRATRQQTDRVFNINLFVPNWGENGVSAEAEANMAALLGPLHTELDAGDVPSIAPLFAEFDEQFAVMVEEQVPVMSFHFGVPPEVVQKAKSAGAKVLCSATTVAEAKTLEGFGVDAVIAQGSEAGGHRGTFAGNWQNGLVGTLALFPQIADAVSVPVIAAGGIMDGRGMAACLTLGAQAVQMGTAFLACPENDIAPAYRNAVLGANEDLPAVTEVFSGRAARGLRNRYYEEMRQHEDKLLPFPAHYSIFRGLRAKATELDDPDFLPMWAGQGVGLAVEQPAADLVSRVVNEARTVPQQTAANC